MSQCEPAALIERRDPTQLTTLKVLLRPTAGHRPARGGVQLSDRSPCTHRVRGPQHRRARSRRPATPSAHHARRRSHNSFIGTQGASQGLWAYLGDSVSSPGPAAVCPPGRSTPSMAQSFHALQRGCTSRHLASYRYPCRDPWDLLLSSSGGGSDGSFDPPRNQD